MAVIEPLVGKYISLKVAGEEVAEFTLNIRNDKELTSYIPMLGGNITDQKNWINKQRNEPFDTFFVLCQHDDTPVGTLSYYNLDKTNNTCEIGRFISYGNPYENVEAIVLMLDYLYFKKKISRIILSINENNRNVILLWKRFGAVYQKEEKMKSWNSLQYWLEKDAYCQNRDKIVQVLGI